MVAPILSRVVQERIVLQKTGQNVSPLYSLLRLSKPVHILKRLEQTGLFLENIKTQVCQTLFRD